MIIKMATIDFFVHPEYPLFCFSSICDYWVAMHEATEKSNNPVKVDTLFLEHQSQKKKEIDDEKFVNEFIPKDRFIYTIASTNDEFDGCGFIEKNSWKKLEEICKDIKPSDNIRIHGSFYWYGCLLGFSMQLYGLLEKGGHWC